MRALRSFGGRPEFDLARLARPARRNGLFLLRECEPMAKRLLLVRHARVAANHAGRFIGATDLPLDDLGHSQSRALAGRVASWRRALLLQPHAAMHSDGAALAGHLAIALDDDLREIDFGRWEIAASRSLRARTRRWWTAGRRSPRISRFPAENGWPGFCSVSASRPTGSSKSRRKRSWS